jgi:hypothetical protein
MLSHDDMREAIETAQSYKPGSRNQQVTAPLVDIISDLQKQLEREKERNRNLQDIKSRITAERDTYEEQARHNAEKNLMLQQQANELQHQLQHQPAQTNNDQADEIATLQAALDEKDRRWMQDMQEAGERFKRMTESNEQQRNVLYRRIRALEEQLTQVQAEYSTSTAGNPHAQDKGGKLPYGYSRTSQGTEVKPGEAAIVKRIFQHWDKGQSARQIARDLNSDEIPTPRRGSKGWTHQAVNIILGNAHIYLGNDEHYPAILNTASPRQVTDLPADILH